MSGFRIPIITYTPDGSLVALAEGRKLSSNDYGPKLLSVRRSTDGGMTWHITNMPEDDDSTTSSSLGVILTDHVANITMVIFTRCHPDCSNSTTYVMKTYDNGLTWKDPEDISKQTGEFPFYGGPGYGIQVGYDI